MGLYPGWEPTTLDDLAVRRGKLGVGDRGLQLETGEPIDAVLDEVEVGEERGLHAEGRSEEREILSELTAAPQPGGSVSLRRRPFRGDGWDEVGEVTGATKQG